MSRSADGMVWGQAFECGVGHEAPRVSVVRLSVCPGSSLVRPHLWSTRRSHGVHVHHLACGTVCDEVGVRIEAEPCLLRQQPPYYGNISSLPVSYEKYQPISMSN
jgi:hypothetical protein